jgi:N-acetylglucosamine malate deacetylase 1
MQIDILAFGAHPDDVELSAAGSLLKHKSMGKSIGIIDLTLGELGTRGNSETRKMEASEASQILGLDIRENLEMADGFFEINQENLLKVIQVIRKYKPRVVLANAPSDRHPDHARGAELVSRACFLAGLPKIQTFNNRELQESWRPKVLLHYIQDQFIKPDFVIDITRWHEEKMRAIAAFKTQFYNPNSNEPQTPISSKEFWELLKGKAQLMGRYASFELGEGFIQSRPSGIEEFYILS